jgi:transposase-like protein
MQASRAAMMLDEELESWRSRLLGETPYLFLDAWKEDGVKICKKIP